MAMAMANRDRNRVLFFFFLNFGLNFKIIFSNFTLHPGETLRRYGSLISNSNQFKLHFFPLPHSSWPDETQKIYLGITMNDQDPVWLANYTTPFDGDGDESRDPMLLLDDYGNLKILQNDTYDPFFIFFSGETRKINSTIARLQDNGNFELVEVNESGDERLLWQSFDYPTNILLMGMKLRINKKTGQKHSLTSWVAPNSPVLGSFTLGMDPNNKKQLVMWWKDNVFWKSGELGFDLSFPNLKPKSANQNYSFLYHESEDEASLLYFANMGEPLGIVLNAEGDLDGGAFVMCNGDNPVFASGCVAMELPTCRKTDKGVKIKKGYMEGDGYKFEENNEVSVFDCRMMCLNTCSCYAYASISEENSRGCHLWDKGTPFKEHSLGKTTYFLPGDEDIHNGSTGINHRKIMNVCIASVIAGALMILMLSYLYILSRTKWRPQANERLKQKMILSEIRAKGQKACQMHVYSFESMVMATDNFAPENELAHGGFGVVYKGILLDGQEVAIKRQAKSSRQGLLQFQNEIELIPILQHTNLIRLCGFCIEREELMLIYEYMPNKSLDFYIYDSENRILLDCKRRFSIIQGIAQGLVYLHAYSRLSVIHGDLKPSNILLDHEMNPKISDFGVAKILSLEESEKHAKGIGGTYGYMPPEYVQHGIISTKTDVFSFGVLILEIVTGTKHFYHSDYPHTLLEYAWQMWNEGRAFELVEPLLEGGTCMVNKILRCIHIGLLCVQDQAIDRPTMLQVVSFLSNETMVLPPPKQPAFFINVLVRETEFPDADREEKYSFNDVTISPIVGR